MSHICTLSTTSHLYNKHNVSRLYNKHDDISLTLLIFLSISAGATSEVIKNTTEGIVFTVGCCTAVLITGRTVVVIQRC